MSIKSALEFKTCIFDLRSQHLDPGDGLHCGGVACEVWEGVFNRKLYDNMSFHSVCVCVCVCIGLFLSELQYSPIAGALMDS
jgi:hypothetical protein